MVKQNVATIFFLASILGALSACSLYESSGHKAIEENSDNLLGLSGLVATDSIYYSCAQSKDEPEFLKEPFEVVATPFDSAKFTTLFNATADSSTLIVYTVNERNTYTYCHLSNVNLPDGAHRKFSAKKIQRAAQIGVDELKLLLSSQQ